MNAGVKTVLLLGTLSGLVLALGGSLGGEAGLLLAFVIAIAMNFGSYWFSDKIVFEDVSCSGGRGVTSTISSHGALGTKCGTTNASCVHHPR